MSAEHLKIYLEKLSSLDNPPIYRSDPDNFPNRVTVYTDLLTLPYTGESFNRGEEIDYGLDFSSVTTDTPTWDTTSKSALRNSLRVIKELRKGSTFLDDIVQSGPTPTGVTRVIIDMDAQGDCDDLGAMRIAAWAERMGYWDIVAYIMSNKSDGIALAAGIDAFMSEDGRPGLAIGTDKNSGEVSGGTSSYNSALLSYPHTLVEDDTIVEDSNMTYKRAIQAAIDDGVKIDIITTGTLRGLRDFMREPALDGYASGMDLIEAGVGEVWSMGGQYPAGSEYNFDTTNEVATSTEYVINNLDKPHYFCGTAIGNAIISGANLASVYTERGVDIMRDGYADAGHADGRPSWDPITMLMAAVFNNTDQSATVTGIKGTNVGNSVGGNAFTVDPDGIDTYFELTAGSSNFYRDWLNHIYTKTDWPVRDDIGVFSIPRISTYFTVEKGIVNTTAAAGDTVTSFSIVDNEVEVVTVDFASGTNLERYYGISGNNVVLTQAAINHLSTVGNKLPNLVLATSTGVRRYAQVHIDDNNRRYTKLTEGTFLTPSTPMYLEDLWTVSLSVTVPEGVSTTYIFTGEDDYALGCHIKANNLYVYRKGYYNAKANIYLGSDCGGKIIDIKISRSTSGYISIESEIIGKSDIVKQPDKLHIEQIGGSPRDLIITGSIKVTRMQNTDVYKEGVAEFHLDEDGTTNGYKYYNADDDTDSTYLVGTGLTESNVSDTPFV